MARQYARPPIIEALCEFRFVPSRPWDMTVPGLLYEKIRDQFPEKQQQVRFDVRLEGGEEGLEQKVETAPRIQFRRADDSALVQVGPDLLAVNHLPPYPTWPPFKQLILDTLGQYEDVAAPEGLRRVGLRYINRIEFEAPRVELTEYFHYHPEVPDDLAEDHGPFSVQVKIPKRRPRDLLSVTLRSIASGKEGVLAIILDLDYAMVQSEALSLDNVGEWVEEAHSIVHDAFEACVTDRCRELFGGKGCSS